MKKCDVIIPVYKSPEWVKLCIYALFKNTDIKNLNKVFLINDCDDEFTSNCLGNLKEKYGTKIEVVQNDMNLGFIKSTNRGLKLSKSDYVLLLNTDCLVSPNTIGKLIAHMEKDQSVGLICPISSNAANLTLEMFEGFNYTQMDALLEKKFRGISFDACTVVGNCLMISRDCLNKVGYLDEAYGMGYGEETDYQFKAMEKGYKAKVAIDTYVFHKSEVSFGTSKEKQERLNKNRDLFFSRWGTQYNQEMAKYVKNDPIKYIESHLADSDRVSSVESIFYLNGIAQNAGGVHVVVDIVNYLTINGEKVNVLYDFMSDYKEIMLFNPISSTRIDMISPKQIISTIYQTTFAARKIADAKKIKLLSFVQGYETYFENASVYGIVETSYKLADSIFTISDYLKQELKNVFHQDSVLIRNGIHYDLIGHKSITEKIKTITVILRNNVMKGDWILLDIVKKISLKYKNLDINLIYSSNSLEFPHIEDNTIRVHKILGPLGRNEIYKILQQSDVYIDCSLSEGFGLTALEAMAAGCVPIVSNSKGVKEYIKDGINGFLIDAVNDSDAYMSALDQLLSMNDLYFKLRDSALSTAREFDFDFSVDRYAAYLADHKKFKSKLEKLNEQDQLIIEKMEKIQLLQTGKKRKIYKLARIIPKGLKNRIKKLITFLYFCFEH